MKVTNMSRGTEALAQSMKSEAGKPKVIDELIKFQEASGALKAISNGTYYFHSCQLGESHDDIHTNERHGPKHVDIHTDNKVREKNRYMDTHKDYKVEDHTDAHLDICSRKTACNTYVEGDLPLLVAALKNHNPRIRYRAAGLLGQMGVASTEVMSALSFIARKDAEPEVRRIATKSLTILIRILYRAS